MTIPRHMTTAKQINEATRDGGNGRNVYVAMEGSQPNRVTRARTKAGKLQVKLLWSGEWLTVDTSIMTVWQE